MTRAEIIRMAQEWVQIAYRDADTTTFTVHNMHVAFAAGAAAERDACAQIVEASPSYDWHRFACEVAAAIRARGEK